MAERGQGVDVTQHGLAEAGNPGKEVRPVKRCTRQHGRMIERDLRTEVETLFSIGLARRQLATEWKVSAPGPAAARHRDLILLRLASCEKLAAQCLQSLTERFVNAVIDDVEEPGLPARGSDLLRRVNPLAGAMHQRSDVDHRNV